jgi:glycine/D-amino acid oxidase-like deaminating enzyme
MIQNEIDVPLHQLSKLIGSEKAIRAWRRSASSMDALVNLAQSLGIDCSMQRQRTLYLAGDAHGSRALRNEAGARIEAHIKAEFCDAAKLASEFGIDRSGAIISSLSASANAAQLAAGMLKAAHKYGAERVSPLWITYFEETIDGVTLATSEGRLLRCGHVIFASGYEFLREMESSSH